MLSEWKRIELRGILERRGLTQVDVGKAMEPPMAEATLSRVLRARQPTTEDFEVRFLRGVERAAEERTKRVLGLK